MGGIGDSDAVAGHDGALPGLEPVEDVGGVVPQFCWAMTVTMARMQR
jgi:hypothetical protein